MTNPFSQEYSIIKSYIVSILLYPWEWLDHPKLIKLFFFNSVEHYQVTFYHKFCECSIKEHPSPLYYLFLSDHSFMKKEQRTW